jgi:hypothetical protein
MVWKEAKASRDKSLKVASLEREIEKKISRLQAKEL